MQNSIPISNKWQSKLWSSNVANLDLKKDKTAIIHKVLSMGDLEDIKLLFELYGKSDVKQEFLAHPMNVYAKSGFNFIKKFILNLKDTPIDQSKYVKNIY